MFYLKTDDGSTDLSLRIEKYELPTEIIIVVKNKKPKSAGERLIISPPFAIPIFDTTSKIRDTK